MSVDDNENHEFYYFHHRGDPRYLFFCCKEMRCSSFIPFHRCKGTDKIFMAQQSANSAPFVRRLHHQQLTYWQAYFLPSAIPSGKSSLPTMIPLLTFIEKQGRGGVLGRFLQRGLSIWLETTGKRIRINCMYRYSHKLEPCWQCLSIDVLMAIICYRNVVIVVDSVRLLRIIQQGPPVGQPVSQPVKMKMTEE